MSTLREKVFISYSHADKGWLDKIHVMLKPLVRNKAVVVWDDTKIKPGAKWREEIKLALAEARVAVLLVSPTFLASDFIAEHEVPQIFEAAASQGLTILWVAISPCLWDQTEIASYQAVNDPSAPLDSLTESQVNRVLVQICRRVQEAVLYETTQNESHASARLPSQEELDIPPDQWYSKPNKKRNWLLRAILDDKD